MNKYGQDKKHKEKQLCCAVLEKILALLCEWELREANLLICFAGAQLFKAFRWNVIKTGISESCAGSCTCSAPSPLTLERTLWMFCVGCIEWFKLG